MADSKNTAVDRENREVRQVRAVVTRRKLLQAARAIFARDGFDQARIEDIAARAGKTRGAFYGNFTDKEDVFFAIFEEDLDGDRAEIGSILKGLSTLEEQTEALSLKLMEISNNRQRTLLNLEFKLYAIRHPSKQKRLANLHALMRIHCSIPEIYDLLPRLTESADVRHTAESLVIGSIMDGLALSRLFDPEGLDERQSERYLKLCIAESFKER